MGEQSAVNWICDREQCRYTMEDRPDTYWRQSLPKGKSRRRLLLAFAIPGAVLFTIGLGLIGIILAYAFYRMYRRRYCPACRRGNMLDAHEGRGYALACRKMQQHPRADRATP